MKEQEEEKNWAFCAEGVVSAVVDVHLSLLGESRTVLQSNPIAGKWVKIIII